MKSIKVNNICKYLSFSIVLVLLWSCSNDEEAPLKKDAEFFPLTVGGYFVYNVEESKYSPIEGRMDFLYQLRLVVVDSFKNTAGGVTYVIHRFTKPTASLTFGYLDTWSVRIEASEVVVNEGDVPFVKLSFPLVLNKEWNGNALNTLGGEELCGQSTTFSCDLYVVEAVNTPFEVNGETLAETVEVLQNNNTDLIVKQDVRKEIYARNIGLVYKESTVLNYCTVGPCIGQQQIESGFTLKQTLISYGKE